MNQKEAKQKMSVIVININISSKNLHLFQQIKVWFILALFLSQNYLYFLLSPATWYARNTVQPVSLTTVTLERKSSAGVVFQEVLWSHCSDHNEGYRALLNIETPLADFTRQAMLTLQWMGHSLTIPTSRISDSIDF